MRRLILIAAACLAFSLAYASDAEAKMYACSGVKVNPAYLAHFDTVRGQVRDGAVRYARPTHYMEFQTWLTMAGHPPGPHSEHEHWGACIAQGETWRTRTRNLDVIYISHNVTGYKPVSVALSFNGCRPGQTPGVDCTGNVHPNYPAVTRADSDAALPAINAAMKASDDMRTTTVFRSYQLGPALWNGQKEMRGGVTVARDGPTALVESWSLDARWYPVDNYLGLPNGSIWPGARYLRMRTIVTFNAKNAAGETVSHTDYHHSGFCDSDGWNRAKLVSLPTKPTWNVCLRITDGGGPAVLAIDPGFHDECSSGRNCIGGVNFGRWVKFFTGFSPPGVEYIQTHAIPLGSLGLKRGTWHKLVLLSHDEAECIRGHRVCPPDVRPTWTNVVVLPFRAP